MNNRTNQLASFGSWKRNHRHLSQTKGQEEIHHKVQSLGADDSNPSKQVAHNSDNITN